MIKIDRFLKENRLKSQMIMQVHDELVFNVVSEELDIIKKEVSLIMENIISAPIKLTVDI
jgi:DNA polymerase-1